MKIIIYYFAMLIINTVTTLLFRESINLSTASTLPVVLMLLSLLQGFYFKHNRSKNDFNTSSSSDLTEEEWHTLAGYMSNAFFISLPLFIPFILFFGTWVKVISIIVYLASFVGGSLYYRIKHRKEFNARMKRESEELKEQLKKEELGMIK